MDDGTRNVLGHVDAGTRLAGYTRSFDYHGRGAAIPSTRCSMRIA
jgi:hypothetical protein